MSTTGELSAEASQATVIFASPKDPKGWVSTKTQEDGTTSVYVSRSHGGEIRTFEMPNPDPFSADDLLVERYVLPSAHHDSEHFKGIRFSSTQTRQTVTHSGGTRLTSDFNNITNVFPRELTLTYEQLGPPTRSEISLDPYLYPQGMRPIYDSHISGSHTTHPVTVLSRHDSVHPDTIAAIQREGS